MPNMAFAALRDHKMLSWNMEGFDFDPELTWKKEIAGLLAGSAPDCSQAPDIVALQSIGELPAGAEWVKEHEIRRGIRRFIVNEYRWYIETGAHSETRYIYHLNNWPAGSQKNMALLTKERAEAVLIIPPQPLASGMSLAERPLLGVQLDADTAVFTIHAAPYAEPASNEVDHVMTAAMAEIKVSQWAILGNFNRTQEQISLPAGLSIYPTRGSEGFDLLLTHDSRGNWAASPCRLGWIFSQSAR